MRNLGIQTVSWHNRYRECPNSRTFLVLLSKEGAVQDLLPLERSQVSDLRKYEVPNQGISFPVFNVPPLLHATTDEAKSALKAVRNVLNEKDAPYELSFQRIWDECLDLWTPKKLADIDKCLKSAGLRERLGDSLEHQALDELFKRSAQLNADRLKEGIKMAFLNAAARLSGDMLKLIEPLLVTMASKPPNVSLALELADRSSFTYPANHAKIQTWINSRLLANDAEKNDSATSLDAFGRPLDNQDTFPTVKLPLIGPVILRSMNKEYPCQKRYGRAGGYSFPAGTAVRQEAKDSLEWLARREHKGMTWEDVSGASHQAAVLFAYPARLSTALPALASLFGGEDPDGTRFKKAAKQIVNTLSGTISKHPTSGIRVFALAKADRARTKMLFSSSYGVEELLSAAHTWQEGCKNIPWIEYRMTGSGQPPVVPVVPLPSHVVECANTAWLRGAAMARQVHGLKVGEGIGLLAEGGIVGRGIVHKTLHLTVRNATTLLLALGHENHRVDGSLKTQRVVVWHAQRLPSLLGLLLYRLSIKRSDYMHDAPFLVGRLLSLSDTLHREYCRHVRKNDLPPQLLGNTLMSMCLENPAEGLARLSERLPLYKGWADTEQGKDVGLAKWVLGQMAQVSNELSALPLPGRASDTDKAQMLLGYLAWSGKESDKTATTSN